MADEASRIAAPDFVVAGFLPEVVRREQVMKKSSAVDKRTRRRPHDYEFAAISIEGDLHW
jgi:hypothetical protein